MLLDFGTSSAVNFTTAVKGVFSGTLRLQLNLWPLKFYIHNKWNKLSYTLKEFGMEDTIFSTQMQRGRLRTTNRQLQ
uniref:Uncharacterized protein n=1 Tax=Romanomermis culicivorax TaxID=13658 RepID=A0A915IUW9_ROMCU